MTQRGLIREVSWRELFPWLVIFRSFRLSISASILLLATAATLLTQIGWEVGSLFLTEEESQTVLDATPPGVRSAFSTAATPQETVAAPRLTDLLASRLTSTVARMEGVYYGLSAPFRALFRTDLSITQFAYYLSGGLWTLLVWALFGGVITRIAVMRLGREENVSLKSAFQLTLKRYRSFISAPLGLLFLIAFLALLMTPVGLLMRLDFGVVIVGILWCFVLAMGALLTLIFFGLLFGWPLMWPTISAEVQGDAFEAVQRSFSYTFERPAHYLFYAFVAAVTGGLGWLAVDLLCDSVIAASHWSVSYGAGLTAAEDLSGRSLLGTNCLWFWESLLRNVKIAYGFAFFWCAASAIYLTLRQNVDATEFDEVYVEGEENRYDLPTLEPVDTTVPEMQRDESPASDGSSD